MRINARQIVSAVLAAFALAIAPSPGFAQVASGEDPFYCGERDLGRYFYCNRDRVQKDEGATPQIIEGVSSNPSATEEVAAIREQLEELRAEAVLRPTTESVSAYIRYQREQLDRASAFSDVWRRALWMDPSLDYNLVRPVSQIGKRNWLDTRKEERTALLTSLNERYGLFYFYAASCSACTEFSPLLRAFADQYGISVKAVSTDGGPNPHFPEAVIDRGQMARLGLSGSPTPTVVLFDTTSRTVTPIAFGIVSQSELEERIYVLTQTAPGEDY